MSTQAAQAPAAPSPSKALNVTLWILQSLLALAFVLTGVMKLALPVAAAAKNMPWVTEMPWLLRFIGVAELAGGLGMILPAATRILPSLTALAGVGLFVVMLLAAGYHFTHGEAAHTPPVFVLAAMAAFVAWGRFKKAPIRPRG